MRMMLFLGSGVSIPSGLPRVQELTDSLLNDAWHWDAPSFRPGPPNDPVDPTLDLQKFLKVLKIHADEYYALRGGHEVNYEDIYYLAQQIRDDEAGRILNPAIFDFLKTIRTETDELSKRVPEFWVDDSLFHNMVIGACALMQCVVEEKLSTPSQIEGLELIKAMASSHDIDRLDIVTLNHDILVERFLTDQGFDYVDGFGRGTGDSTVRPFHPELFDGETKVRIFKLHGSINWFMFADKGQPFCGIPVNGDPNHSLNEQGKELENIFGGAIYLAGTHNKIINYGYGIIAEMHFLFHKLLKECDTICMCGYGWNDFGVNIRLCEWFCPPRKTRLCLMHEHPEEILQNPRSLMGWMYDGLIAERRLILIKKWMENVTLSELLNAFSQ